MAQSTAAMVSINSLKRKLLGKKRRKRRSRGKQNSSTAGANAPAVPTRNPRKIKKAKEAVMTAPFLPVVDFLPLPTRNPRKLKAKTAVKIVVKKPAKKVLIKEPVIIAIPVTRVLPALPSLPTRRPNRHPSKIDDGSWSPKSIKQARDRCTILFRDIIVKGKPLAPMKKGRCGNPAPVSLSSIGKNPAVILHPAATLSCPMVTGLALWFEQSVQVLAKKHLGKKVKRLTNVSSYVCRNRYGDTTKRISEHSYANALDIAGFELEDGSKVIVLKDWDDENNGASAFLRALHKSACGIFGTVLGPEANAAHKDHFHLDMAPRKRSNYCR